MLAMNGKREYPQQRLRRVPVGIDNVCMLSDMQTGSNPNPHAKVCRGYTYGSNDGFHVDLRNASSISRVSLTGTADAAAVFLKLLN